MKLSIGPQAPSRKRRGFPFYTVEAGLPQYEAAVAGESREIPVAPTVFPQGGTSRSPRYYRRCESDLTRRPI